MVENLLKKFELNNAVLEDFDDLMSKHLDQIEELVISEIDAKSKLLNIVGLCINVKTLIIEGDQRTNVNSIIANICKPELLQNLILNGVKIPSSFSFKKLVNLRMVSLNNIRFCSVRACLDEIVNPEKIEALNFEEVDFAKNSIDILSKFTNLKYLNLIKVQNCKLNNLDFLSQMENLEKINIERNLLDLKEINNIVKCKFNKQISVELNSKNQNVVTNFLEISEAGKICVTINSSDLEELTNSINLYKINDILIIVENQDSIKDYIHILKRVKGKISISIKDVSCLSVKDAKDIKEKLNVEYINIIDFDEALKYEKNRYCYDIDKYIKIRKAIDEIIENINSEADELTKFLELYKMLGESIMYDNMVEEGVREYSNLNEAKSSNLENGLLEKKCIDAGYAEILKNCLAVLGINSKIIRGSYAGGEDEHIWNQVKVLSNWYNVDLSLDSKKMSSAKKLGTKPNYCLLSDKIFRKTHIPKTTNVEYCAENFDQKIIGAFFKKEPIVKIYIQNLINKIRKLFSYNSQKALPVGKHLATKEDIKKEKNEN